MNQRVLIAGIGGASLGMEMHKCFALDGTWQLYGADIREDAYGHSHPGFTGTTVVGAASGRGYVEELTAYATKAGVTAIAPGGEVPSRLLAAHADIPRDAGIEPMVNDADLVRCCTDKVATMAALADAGFEVPTTTLLTGPEDVEAHEGYPCVIKPVRDSGASNMVFVAENRQEAEMLRRYVASRGFQACAQAYIEGEEEYTIGVLSSRQGVVLSSIALRRDLGSKLSRSLSYGSRIISSGWSQGVIEDFGDVRQQAAAMARSLGSTWALNVQGRVRRGVLVPFEINPRHSGTSYLRALAGVNEPVIALRAHASDDGWAPTSSIRPGRYHRLLGEDVTYHVPPSTP